MLGQNLEIRIRKLEMGLYISVTFISYDFYSQYTVFRGPKACFDTYLFDLLMGLNDEIVNKIIQVVVS